MSNKNSFKHSEAKKQSKYKLWIHYKSDFQKKFKSNPFTYYSFNTKSDGGLSSLINLAEKRRSMYIIAIIYDTQSNEEIKRWSREDSDKNNYESNQSVGFIKRKRPRIVMPTIKRVW